jgi:hypothetical protein
MLVLDKHSLEYCIPRKGTYMGFWEGGTAFENVQRRVFGIHVQYQYRRSRFTLDMIV